MSGQNPSTPLDIRRGLTKAEDVSFPLRWGILGSGNISSQWVESVRPVPGATVTAIGARGRSKATEFAQRHDIPNVHEGYDDLVNDPDVDIVYVGTITPLHKEHSILALEAGKHVLCEKPLAANASDAREMYEVADRQGVFFQDAMWTRFFPAVEHARFLVESGAIGDVVMVQSDFFDPIYVIQAAPLAFGVEQLPTKVALAGRRSSAAVVEYGEHRCAVLSFPPFNCELPETTHLIGTKGRLTLSFPGHCPTELTLQIPPENGVPSVYRTRGIPAPTTVFEYPIPPMVSIRAPFPNQQGFYYQAQAVHRCIAAGLNQCPQYDKNESLHCMDLLTEINRLRSA